MVGRTTISTGPGASTAIRVKQWAIVFYALQQDSLFSDATRLLMLTSLPEHAHYLRHFHKPGGNWITTELSALGLIAAAWPEFQEATAWQTYCGQTLLRSMPEQIYPDGVPMELTSGYHWVSLWNFEQYTDLCRDAELSLPPGYRNWLEKMWNYLAYSLRPDGCNPLNNDSGQGSFRELLVQAAAAYGRPDWSYIATNGVHGAKPTQAPSLNFPWAGQVIARSGGVATPTSLNYSQGDRGERGVRYDRAARASTCSMRTQMVSRITGAKRWLRSVP